MLKYSLAPLVLIILIICDWMGPQFAWIFFIGFSLFIVIGDTLAGNDTQQYQEDGNRFNPFLYLVLPLLFLKIFNITLLGMGNPDSWIHSLLSGASFFNIWIRPTTHFDLIGMILSSGLLIGGIGTVVGHELVHRKRRSTGFKISNWLLALTWDPAFGIEHIHGHHKYVATYQDPESARRGESVYHFIARSTWGTLRNAWKWEKERLAGKGLSPFSIHNQMFQVYARSALITGVVALGGSISLIVYFGSVIWAKILLETVNYLEHYGLVRLPGTAIEPRHSWNSNHRISSYLLFNLTRHSAHHEKSNLPFWKMNPYSDAPMLPYGYLTMVYFILLIPWVYRRIMIRELKDWDNRFASREELELLSQYQ